MGRNDTKTAKSRLISAFAGMIFYLALMPVVSKVAVWIDGPTAVEWAICRVVFIYGNMALFFASGMKGRETYYYARKLIKRRVKTARKYRKEAA